MCGEVWGRVWEKAGNHIRLHRQRLLPARQCTACKLFAFLFMIIMYHHVSSCMSMIRTAAALLSSKLLYECTRAPLMCEFPCLSQKMGPVRELLPKAFPQAGQYTVRLLHTFLYLIKPAVTIPNALICVLHCLSLTHLGGGSHPSLCPRPPAPPPPSQGPVRELLPKALFPTGRRGA